MFMFMYEKYNKKDNNFILTYLSEVHKWLEWLLVVNAKDAIRKFKGNKKNK